MFSKDNKRKKRAAVQADPILDKVVYTFPDGKDTLSARELSEGVLITGASGSGKSSGFANGLFQALIKSGYGGLILSVKTESAKQILETIEKCHEDDTL